MTDAQFKQAIAAIFKDWQANSQTTNPATWDDKEEQAWSDIFDALALAGGQPQGHPRRRPGS